MGFEIESDFDVEDNSSFYKKRLIEDIQPNDDTVMLTGYAKSVNASEEFNLDDTTGKIHIRDIPEESVSIQEGKMYRVIGQMLIDGAGTSYISAKYIVDFEGLNLDLFLKSMKLVKKIP